MSSRAPPEKRVARALVKASSFDGLRMSVESIRIRVREAIHIDRGFNLTWRQVPGRFALPVLELEQPEVDAALREQLLMCAGLAQLPLVQDEDLVHVLDGRQAMRDRNRRAAGHQRVQGVANQELGLGIDARRRFVEDE